MPNDSLSQVGMKYAWRGQDQDDPTGTEDYEMGGVALNDNSLGTEYQLWTFKISGADNKTITAEAPNTNGAISLYTPTGTSDVTEIACTFDQNMHPFVAFNQGAQWHYWWYDAQSAGMLLSDLPAGVDSCRCCLDDKRQFNSTNSDVLLFYTLNNNLYMRRQRDRFQNEMLLRTSIGGKLVKVGMNGISRLQFKLMSNTI